MSFSSSQYQSPIYTNLTTVGTTDLNNVTTTGITNMLGQLTMSAGSNIDASSSLITTENLNVDANVSIGGWEINLTGNPTINGSFALGGGTTMNASNSSIDVETISVSQNGSLNLGSGANINASNSSISGAFINCGLDTTIDRNLIFNENGSSVIYNTFALEGGTTMNASNSNISVHTLSFNPNATITQYTSQGQTSSLYFSAPSNFYFNGSVNTNQIFTPAADVGLLTSVSPVQPSDKSHVGFVLNETLANAISLITNSSNNVFSFSLPIGTWMISGVIQLEVPSSTIFSSCSLSQKLSNTTVKTFNNQQLTSNSNDNDVIVNVPIFNTIFNSVEQNFILSVSASYTSNDYINITTNSYLILTRVA
jgi:hypothetical protein